MNLSKLMIATLAVCGVSQALAAGPARLTGASASSINVARAAKVLCENAGGTYTLYKIGDATGSLGNVFTGKCDVDFEGISEDEVRVNVSGGSENAIINATAGGNVKVGFINAATASCTTIAAAGTGSLSFMGAGRMRNCTGTNESATSDGGYLDVEGNHFNANYNAGDFTPAGFSQVFGVAVNKRLYEALQTHQKTTGQVPASCAVGDATAACQPSISKADIATLINNGTSASGAKSLGGGLLIPGNTTKISYCMRPQTSGTQQAAQLYFLNYEATAAVGGKVPVVAEGASVGSRYSSILNSGSSNVRACLNDTAPATSTDFRFGVLSAENNPLGSSTDTYRFVKLNDVAFAEGVAGSSQTASAIAGRYDFVYETVAYCPEGTCAPIVDAMNGALPAGASTPGLFLTGVESKYGRGGNSAVPYTRR
jgi:hypothetical protein